jgi:hypothetical protein
MATALVGTAVMVISAFVKVHDTDQGFFSLFVGVDRRASTSKTQLLLWTLLVAFALSYIATRAVLSKSQTFVCPPNPVVANCVLEESWSTYLILLGLPAAAVVLAKGILAAKLAAGDVQKTTAAGPSASDVATDDNGKADLADVQYLVFNLIAMCYVAATVIDRGVLPEVPAVLLALTGTAAGAYVLNKGFQTNKPLVTAVVPGVIAPELDIRVSGRNFFPAGVTADTLTVKVGGVSTLARRERDPDFVTFAAPSRMTQADPTLRVVTEAGAESAPFPVTIQGFAPTVIGWATDPAPAPNGPGELTVSGLGQETAADVAFGTIVVRGIVEPVLKRLKVTVPPGVPAGSMVDVAVGSGGVWSDRVALPIA